MACLTAAGAEEPPPPLAEVVITATRTSIRGEDTAVSATAISRDEIERRRDLTAPDALRGAPGLDVIEFGSPGRTAFASLRGAAPDQVLVLLDGVEVNSPTVGQFDFSSLTTDAIDRIEVLRGGGGTLYGSEAIGGVINVITRRGEGPLRVYAGGEAGSAATHRETVGLGGAHGRLGLATSTSFFASDGFGPINDDYRNFSTVWRADADLLRSGTLRGFLRYTNTEAGLMNFNATDGVLDPDARSRADFFLAKSEWEHAPGDTLTYRAATSIVRHNERFRDLQLDSEEPGEIEPVIIARFPTELLGAEAQVDHLWRDTALTTLGLAFKERSARVFEQELEHEEDDEGHEETEIEIEQFGASRSSVGVYAQEQLRFFDGALHGAGGLRYDAHDGFGDRVTLSGSGFYLVRRTNTRLRLGYTEGFRAPTFEELFERTGNPNLRAEESWELSAGFTQEFFDSRLRFEPTYFYREVTNLVEEIADQLPGWIAGVPEDSALTANVNARFQGAELIAQAQPVRGLALTANYTYLDFDTPSGTLLNRPRHRGAFSIASEHPGLLKAGDRVTATLRVSAVGARDSADPLQHFATRRIGGYGRTDLSLSYRPAGQLGGWVVSASMRNLFDRDYSEAIGFPAPPAHFLIGLRYQPV